MKSSEIILLILGCIVLMVAAIISIITNAMQIGMFIIMAVLSILPSVRNIFLSKK